MKSRLAVLLLVVAALFTTPLAPAPAASGPYPAGDVEIVVDGAPLPRYPHDGRWYVEAVKGREYAIRLRNLYPVRVGVALSVDGLNTIDARQTSAAEARKWVLAPYQTVTISGWQTSRSDARRFEFTTEERSYGQALGRTANLGIISVVFFRERTPVPYTFREERVVPSPAPAAPAAPRAGSAEGAAGGASGKSTADGRSARQDEYAATGMGRRTDHAITEVWLDLERTPAHSVDIRYEFRPQLVRLGILPRSSVPDPLTRRERSNGFEPGFAPAPPHLR